MSKHKRRGEVKRYHLYLGASGMLAAVALVTAVAFGMTSAQGTDPAAECASAGGTWQGQNASPPCLFQGQHQQCPTGQTGTPPNCTAATCPTGQTGTPPNCTAATCPTGQTGTPPNCTASGGDQNQQHQQCPAGTTGTPPNCTAATQTDQNQQKKDPYFYDGNKAGCDAAGYLWCPNVNSCAPSGGRCPAARLMNGEETRHDTTEDQGMGMDWGSGGNPASYGGNESGCNAAGFLWCSNINDCFPKQSRCPDNRQDQDMFFRDFNKDAYGEEFGFDRDKFQFEDQDRPRTPPLKQMQRDAARILKDLNRDENEMGRMIKRSGSDTCPAIAKVQAALEGIRSAAGQLQTATDENEAASLWIYLHGEPSDMGPPEGGVLMTLHGGPDGPGLFQQMGVCEASGHFLKEIARFKTEIERDLAKMSKHFDESELTPWTEALEALEALEANPFEGVDFDEFFDPRELFEKLEEIRFSLDDARRELGDRRSEERFDEGYSQMIREISMFAKQAKGECKALAEKGLGILRKAQKEGQDFGKVMSRMERMKDKVDKLGCFEDFEGEEGEFEDGEDEFSFGLDTGDILGDELDEDLLAKLEERLLSRLENAVKLATAAIESQFAEKLANLVTAFEEKFQNAISAAVESAINNLAHFDKKVQEDVMENRDQIVEIIKEIGEVDLPTAVENKVEMVTELVLKENLTAEAADEIKEKFDTFHTLAANEDDAKILAEEVATLEKEVREVLVEDIPKQVEEGHRAFEDAPPSDWFGGYAMVAKESGVIKGAKGGTVLEPGREINRAEAIAVVVRQENGGEEPEEGSPSVVPPGAPEWSLPYLKQMEDEHPEVYDELKTEPFNEGITRGETAFVLGEVFNENLEEGEVTGIRDEGDIPEKYSDHVGAMIENNIMTGRERPEGRKFEPDGKLTRAEFAKVSTVTAEVVGEGKTDGGGPGI